MSCVSEEGMGMQGTKTLGMVRWIFADRQLSQEETERATALRRLLQNDGVPFEHTYIYISGYVVYIYHFNLSVFVSSPLPPPTSFSLLPIVCLPDWLNVLYRLLCSCTRAVV